MIDYDGMRETIATGLSNYMKCPVIRSNQNEEPPSYPYCSYTITTPKSENKGTYGKYADGKERKPHTQTWSITVQGADDTECITLALKAHEWLDHVGKAYLNDKNVIVQSVGSITNRDNVLTIEYEYKKGFDVVFWLLNEVDDTTAEIGYVEGVEFNNVEIVKGPTTEELAEKLQTRLTGR